MNLFSSSSILIMVSCLSMAILVFLKGKRTKPQIIWGIFCLGAALWGLGTYKASIAPTEEDAVFWWQVTYISVIFAPVIFSHFVYNFLKVKRTPLLLVSYLLALIFLYFDFFKKELFFGKLEFMFGQFYWVYWLKSRSLAYLSFYIIFYWILLTYTFVLLLKHYRRSKGNPLYRNQIKYFILAMSLAWLGPEGMFLSKFGIKIYPISNFLIALYPIIISYAIVRHHLMDIKLAITHAGVFALVYFPVIFIPLWIAPKFIHTHLWWVPTVLMGIFATVGIFVFNDLRRRAEARILKEERRSHELLTQASRGMIHIHNIKELLELISHITTRTMKLENASIFLVKESSGDFNLAAVRFRSEYQYQDIIKASDPLIQELSLLDEPLVYEEVKLKAQELKHQRNNPIHEIEYQMRRLRAAVIVPAVSNKRLLAFLVLGEKFSKRMYSQEDLATLWTVSYQSALALDNAFLYEKEKLHLAEQSRRQALADMAPGASHQFNNRLATIGATAENLLDLLKNDSQNLSKEELIKMFSSDLELIQGEVAKGKQITAAILQKSKVNLEFAKVDIVKVIQNAINLIRLRRTQSSLAGAREPEITFNYPKDLPLLMLCEGTIQDVFENTLNNDYDAIVIRHKRKIDGDLPYQGKIAINISRKDNSVIITVEDNGIGIKKEDMHKLFTDLFTTKATSEKGVVGGSGLGLNVMRSFVEGHGGKISVESEYAKWTRFTITLPVDFKPPK